MRDVIDIVDEFHTAGLISDEFVEKLAEDISRHILIKESFGEELAGAGRAAGQMFSSMFPNAAHTVKGWLGMNPTVGERIGQGLSGLMEHPLGQHLVIGGVLGGAQMVKNVLTKAMDNMTMNSSYAQMLQQFPDLQKADPSLVHRTFQVVQQYAPSVAKNPTVSGTFVKGILQYPDAAVTPEHVRSLVDVERQMHSMNEPGLIGEMATGASRALGQSAVHTFAPDPMKAKELALREKQDARAQSMDHWQKAQMAMNMFGGGVSAAKNINELREPGFEAQQAARMKGQKELETHKQDLRGPSEAARSLEQQRQFELTHKLRSDQAAAQPGFPLESLNAATHAYGLEHGIDQNTGKPYEPQSLSDLLQWLENSKDRVRPGRR